MVLRARARENQNFGRAAVCSETFVSCRACSVATCDVVLVKSFRDDCGCRGKVAYCCIIDGCPRPVLNRLNGFSPISTLGFATFG